MTNPNWRAQASCAEVDPTLWDTDAPAGNKQAIRICGTCPVRAECDREASEQGIEWGIWAGVDRRPKYRPEPYATEKELARRAQVAETAALKRAAFAQAVEAAIERGDPISVFADSRGIKPASVISRLRIAKREDLIKRWRTTNKRPYNPEAQQILDRLKHDPDPLTAHRRYALEMNT